MSHSLRVRAYVTAVSGTLICSLVVLFADVVINGSNTLSAVVCPIWFVVGVVRTALRPPTPGVGAARILIPVVTGLLVIANDDIQRTIATSNAARVVQACERYRGTNGAYPERLSQLVPHYLKSVPKAKYCCSYNQFAYHSDSLHTLFWWDRPPFGRRAYTFETGTWRYID